MKKQSSTPFFRRALHSCVVALTLLGSIAASAADLAEANKRIERGDFRGAIELARPAAESGNTFAQYLVGHSFILDNDLTQGLQWLNKAADAGEAFAQFDLGIMYLEGKGVEKDVPKAVELFERAAGSQSRIAPLAQSRLGRIHETSDYGMEDVQKAAEWHLKAAQAGNPSSQWALASIHLLRFKKPDDTLRWAWAAVDQGFKPAYKTLGLILLTGFGTPPDYPEAMKWLIKAHDEVNDGGAAYEIGLMYSRGLGVSRDLTQAVDWYRKGAERGDPYAQFSYAQALVRGTEVPKNAALAFEYISKASAANHAPAHAYLGTLYVRGIGTEKNTQLAFTLFEKAANAGSLMGMLELGRAYENGIGTEADMTAALQWYRKAAGLGFPAAQFVMGRLYEQGKGVEASHATASKWFSLSANAGYTPALYLLGRTEMRANNSARDVTAYAWLTLAAQRGYQPAKKMVAELEGRMTQDQIARARVFIGRFTPKMRRVADDE